MSDENALASFTTEQQEGIKKFVSDELSDLKDQVKEHEDLLDNPSKELEDFQSEIDELNENKVPVRDFDRHIEEWEEEKERLESSIAALEKFTEDFTPEQFQKVKKIIEGPTFRDVWQLFVKVVKRKFQRKPHLTGARSEA